MSAKPKRRPHRRKHRAAPTARLSPGDLPKVEFPMKLKCTRCGVTGRYHLGTIFVSPELCGKDHTAIDELIGFTGYVRCKECDAGGPWEYPSDTVLYMTVLIAMKLDDAIDVPLDIGEMRTFDSFRFRYPTQAEEHLQGLIEREPERAFLWVRLGNVYSGGGRPDLAEPAYRRAVELSPDDFEARAAMAELLQETERDSEAVPHWQWVLRLARTARGVDAPLRRSAVSVAVDSLLYAFRDKPERLRFYPEGDEPPMPEPKDNKVILHLREFNLSDPNDLEELCDFFLPPSDTREFSGRKIQHRRRAPRLSFGAAPSPLELDDPIAVRSDGSASRNEPCPCGSGRKYKKCCGAAGAVLRR